MMMKQIRKNVNGEWQPTTNQMTVNISFCSFDFENVIEEGTKQKSKNHNETETNDEKRKKPFRPRNERK